MFAFRADRHLLFEILLLTTVATALCVPQACCGGEQFQAGAAVSIITPDPLLPVSGGVGEPNAVTEKRGELTSRVLVVRDEHTTVAIVGIDVLGFPAVLGDRVRQLVPRIPPSNILIGATHTHSAPDCYAFPLPSGGHTGDLDFMQHVCERTAEAINDAIDHLQPAVLKVNSDKAAPRIAYNYYAPALYDPRMHVLQVESADGAAIATLVNYAIHPEVLGSDAGIISPDCIGPLCDRIEEQTGAPAVFMNSAQGGMVTADNRDIQQPGDPLKAVWPDLRTWDECLRIGRLMADEALRIIADAAPQKSPNVRCDVRRVSFPVETALMKAVIAGSPLKYPHTEDFQVTTQVNLVQIGDACILTIPGEALPNIGYYLKRKMPGRHNLLFGLTNDAFGYILTRVDYNSFDRYDYISGTSLGEMTGEVFIENALQMFEAAKR
ncbi:MAG: hypothetical protein KDA89_17980 [Planctomycetaceae bacterium]|nr:hypothetical protein [Planctomycetaceae bacterium]